MPSPCLVLSLACTPLNTLFKWPELIKRRRALGLYAFLYASIHVLIFVISIMAWRGA
jgi:methionine sulfoxide reductase heme-binding subunit